MIALLASVLGIGGISGLALWFIGPKAILGFLKAIPWQVWACLGVIGALLLLWHIHSGWEQTARKEAFNKGFNVEWRHHQADIKAWKTASIKAEADQKLVNARPGIVSSQIAGESNVQAKEYYDRGHSAADVYFASHRSHSSGTDGNGVFNTQSGSTNDRSTSSQTNLSGSNPTIQGNDGSSDTAVVAASSDTDGVSLSKADFDLLVGNSLRLARVHQDVEALIDLGIAIPLEPVIEPSR
jgi:hypothetical protein